MNNLILALSMKAQGLVLPTDTLKEELSDSRLVDVGPSLLAHAHWSLVGSFGTVEIAASAFVDCCPCFG